MKNLHFSAVLCSLALCCSTVPALASTTAKSASSAVSSKRTTVRTTKAVTKKSSSSAKRSSVASVAATTFPTTLAVNADWVKQWKLTGNEATTASLENVTVMSEGSTSFLRIALPKGAGNAWLWKNNNKPISGLVGWASTGRAPQKNLYLRYSVRLPAGFTYGAGGGSLPGLVTGVQNNVQEQSAAAVHLTWNSEGMLSVGGSYLDDQNNNRGTGVKLPNDNQWHQIDIHVTEQSAINKSNGLVAIQLDKKPIYTSNTVKYVMRSNDHWDGVFVGVSDNAPLTQLATTDQAIDLSGFTISDKPLP
jgi:hypothetical protein